MACSRHPCCTQALQLIQVGSMRSADALLHCLGCTRRLADAILLYEAAKPVQAESSGLLSHSAQVLPDALPGEPNLTSKPCVSTIILPCAVQLTCNRLPQPFIPPQATSICLREVAEQCAPLAVVLAMSCEGCRTCREAAQATAGRLMPGRKLLATEWLQQPWSTLLLIPL